MVMMSPHWSDTLAMRSSNPTRSVARPKKPQSVATAPQCLPSEPVPALAEVSHSVGIASRHAEVGELGLFSLGLPVVVIR